MGVANAVGMAMAEAHLSAVFNKPGYDIVDHYTYALCGDGCLEEGISSEACSLAGHLKLGKMILLYDKNNISIEGDTNDTFTEDVAKRFDAYGWQVIEVRDGNTDVDAIDAAISRAKAEKDKPTIIIVHTTIGYGCPPVAGTASCHGNPLGANISVLKKTLGVPEDKEFYVPEEVYENAKKSGKKALEAQTAWNAMFQEYKKEYPELAKLYKQYMSPVDKSIFDDPAFYEFEKGMASRQSSGIILNRLAEKLPQLMGGSAEIGRAHV